MIDVVTYALLKKKVDNVTLAYSYKGSVSDVESLPSGAELGDLYTVGSEQYVWDGTAWVLIELGEPIALGQIEALFA